MGNWLDGGRGRFRGPMVLAGLLLAQGILLAVWLKKDTRPPKWDSAVHLMTAHHYAEAAWKGNLRGLLLTPTFPGHPPYPPVAHFVMAAGMSTSRAIGASPEDGAVFLLQFFSLGVLAVGCFLVAGRFWGSGAGLAAAALALFAPPLQFLSHEALVDVALAAMVVFAYGCWAWSDKFSRLGWSLAFGLAAGIGCLVKWTFPTYLLPVVGAGIWGLLKSKNRRHILAALALSVLVTAPWYAANLFIVIPKLSRVAGLGVQEGDPSGRTLAGWLWYVRILWAQWGGPFVLGGMAGLAWGFFRRMKGTLVLALWFVFSYAIWSSVSNKDPRYLLPAAMVLPIALSSLPMGIPALAATVCAGMAISSLWAQPGGRWRDAPVAQAWPLSEMLEKANSMRGDRTGPSTLILVSNHAYLNGNNLTWTVTSRGWSDRLTVRTKTDRLGEFSDFVIVKTGSLGPPGSVARPTAAREEILLPGGWFQREFTESSRWTLPDGNEALLFVRNLNARPIPGGAPLAGWGGIDWKDVRFSAKPSVRFPGSQRAEIMAREMEFKSVVLGNVRLDLDGLRLAMTDGGPRLLDLQEVSIQSAVWDEESAASLLLKRAPGLKQGRVIFQEEGGVLVSGRMGPVSVLAELGLSLKKGVTEDQLEVRLRRMKVAWFSVPRFFLSRLGEKTLSLGATARRPYGIRLSGLRVVPAGETRSGTLEVGP
ncbi:MAG: glycosyltransferase family 39 protein [Elusimicrobia bacterium]|nr:glycosyltransferase family 39 protein [Elusimicrobiota bacterium]